MKKLQKLVQKEFGNLQKQDGTPIRDEIRVGQLRTLKVQNPILNISSVINELAGRSFILIPKEANAYVSSDFNFGTQFIKHKKAYSVYALQFYRIFE